MDDNSMAVQIQRVNRTNKHLLKFIWLAGVTLLLCFLTPRISLAETNVQPAHPDEHAQAPIGAHEAQGHQTTHLDNWFSFNYGPGKHYQNGPFAFALLNFIILLWVVHRLFSQAVRDYLNRRHSTTRQALEDAAALHQQARQKLDEIENQLKNISTEIEKIKQDVAQDAEIEKINIIKTAEEEAARIIAQTEHKLQQEIRVIHRRLEVEAVNSAIQAANKLIRQQIVETDRKRINEEYLTQISSIGGSH
jgi:F-type H+-transporting ATPase subunit b